MMSPPHRQMMGNTVLDEPIENEKREPSEVENLFFFLTKTFNPFSSAGMFHTCFFVLIVF